MAITQVGACLKCSKIRALKPSGMCTPCAVLANYESREPIECSRCGKLRKPFVVKRRLCKPCYQVLERTPDATVRGTPEHRERMSAVQRANPKRRERAGRWRGGRFVDSQGYVRVLAPDGYEGRLIHGGRYVHEHRLVVEQAIGRLLVGTEMVHHINRKRHDNDLGNLLLLPDIGTHRRLHAAEDRLGIPGLFRRLEELPLIARIPVKKPRGVRDRMDTLTDMPVMNIAQDH